MSIAGRLSRVFEGRAVAIPFETPPWSAPPPPFVVDKQLAEVLARRTVESAMVEAGMPVEELSPEAHYDARSNGVWFSGWPPGLLAEIDRRLPDK